MAFPMVNSPVVHHTQILAYRVTQRLQGKTRLHIYVAGRLITPIVFKASLVYLRLVFPTGFGKRLIYSNFGEE